MKEKEDKLEEIDRKLDYSNSINERALYSYHGRNQSFTRSFGNVMYQDNSLWAASRLKSRLVDGFKDR